MTDEIWKDIPGYEGKYQASNMGRIKSLARIVTSKNQYGDFEWFISEDPYLAEDNLIYPF